VATLLGFPGKLGMSGADVWRCFLAGELAAIRAYCESDVLNTWLVYLAFERLRGNLHAQQFEQECARLREYLAEQGAAERPHLAEFLAAWPA
jgi:predicted PolB exonuclease-like 3'-5' exonuclease